MRRAEKASVRAIGPGVIGADDALDTSPPVEQAHHPMQADVGKAADGAVLAADGEDRLVVDGKGQIVARLGDLGGEPRAEPALGEQLPALEREDLFIVVEPGRKRGRLVRRAVGEAGELRQEALGV